MHLRNLSNQIYRLPWKNNDNPQCFLEITRRCSVGCRSCYQRAGFIGSQNKPLSLIYNEIDVFDKAIHPSAICIIGGEPLEHPQIAKVISYIRNKGIVPALFSNGYLLTQELLKKLFEAGLQVIYAHIDEQTGHHLNSKADEFFMMSFRDRFANLLRPYKGNMYGMVSAIISDRNIQDVPNILEWSYQNADIIKYCVFTIDGQVCGDSYPREIDELVTIIKQKFPSYRVNSFLPGVASKHLHWAQSVALVKSSNNIKYLNPHIVSLLDHLYRLCYQKYVSILNPAIFNLIPTLFTTVIVRPHSQGTIDFCAGCPDQTIIWIERNGIRIPRIVHSCLSQEFISKGYSEDENKVSEAVKNKLIPLTTSLGSYKQELYSSSDLIIRDWDYALRLPRSSDDIV